MAMVKLSAEIISISGKIGGTVFRNDQCGQHAQGFPRILKKETPAQKRLRAAWLDLRNIWWDQLSKAHRRMWVMSAAYNPVTHKNGYQYKLTGWNWFLKKNIPQHLEGYPPEWLPPGYTLEDFEKVRYEVWKEDWLAQWGVP